MTKSDWRIPANFDPLAGAPPPEWPQAAILAGKKGDGFDRGGWWFWPKIACRAVRGCNARIGFVEGHEERFHVVRLREGFREYRMKELPHSVWALTDHVWRQWDFVKTKGVSWERFEPKMRRPVKQRLDAVGITLVSSGTMHTVPMGDDRHTGTFYFWCPKCDNISCAIVPRECGPGPACVVHSLGELPGLSSLGRFVGPVIP